MCHAQFRGIEHHVPDYIDSGNPATVRRWCGFGPESRSRARAATMAAGLELELRVGAVTDDLGDDLFVTALFTRALRNQVHLPALALGVAYVHAEQVAGKQTRFVPAGTGANFHENIALVARIPGQQLLLQLGLDGDEPLFAFAHFGLGQFAHFRIAGQLQCRGNVALAAHVRVVKRDYRASRHARGELR